ncbi:alpha/beta hydrolase [Sphingosinicella soli]|uniref:Acetyl esterase n=1 Tax=Sphingosinicella soli TaxID=333708 RepID=A0A7W7F810_9SPHN|nr:alpha/beta hydrolase [Sphingosinicella soli]MBB4631148.1 acetyl esterase [Sphingosinicella soli]
MFRKHLCTISVFALAVSACDGHTPSPDPASAPHPEDQEIADLAAKPDSWVLEQVGGKRIVLDGQTLDLRMQYLFHQGQIAAEKEAEAAKTLPEKPESDPFDAPQSALETREDANQRWIRRTKPGPELATTDETVTARDGKPIPVRIYRPKAEGPLPVLVYYHGGGWLFGNIEAVDRAMRRLADEAKVMIISTDYRLAPESPYPGSWNDAEDAYYWALENAARLNADASRICVGGDSAGGNMSVVVTARVHKAGKPKPACQLLYYAAVDNRSVPVMREHYDSARLFWNGFGLDEPFTNYVHQRVFPGMDLAQPEISPILADNFTIMPPTLVAAAGFDPLRDSDRAYAEALKKAGVHTVYLEYSALPHGFLQQTAVTQEADRAAGESAREFGKLVAGLQAKKP